MREKWDDGRIEEKLLECIAGLEIDRMPSQAEINLYYGDTALSNKVTKTYGYYGWAKRLNVPIKDSHTQTGRIGEFIALSWLTSYGYKTQKMSTRYPYDLLVEDLVKIDVKFANKLNGKDGSFYYTFGLEKRYPTCDIYLLITHDDKGKNSFYVVPAKNVMQRQISMGINRSIYHKYKDRVDIVEQYIKAFQSVS